MPAFDLSLPPAYYVEDEHLARQWMNHFLQSHKVNNGLGLDSETSGVVKHKDVVMIWSLSDGANRVCFPAKFIPLFKEPILENPQINFDLTNAKFDAHMFANTGADISKAGEWRDTLVQSFLFNENNQGRHGLKECIRDHFDRDPATFEQVFGRLPSKKYGVKKAYADLINEALADPVKRAAATDYAAMDAYNTTILRAYFDQQLQDIPMYQGMDLKKFFYQVEVPFTKVLWRMERRGFQIDAGYLWALKEPMEKRMEEIQKEFAKASSQIINLRSVPAIRWFFYELLKKEHWKKTKGGTGGEQKQSTDVEVLEDWAGQGDPWAKLLLEFRGIDKIYGTYVTSIMELLDSNLRIHTSLNQIGAQSGRLSSSDPNLQNIPAAREDKFRIRDAFIASKGKRLVVADYAQLEMRLMAHFSRDPKMVKAIIEGIDLHCFTVSEMHGIPYEEVIAAVNHEKTFKKGKSQEPLTAREEELIGLRAAAKACVHPDTIVFLNERPTPVFAGLQELGIAPQQIVLTPVSGLTIADGKGGNTPALYVYPMGVQEGVHVITRRGILTCSATHKFKLADHRIVEAKNLKVGEELPETIVPAAPTIPYELIEYKLVKGAPPIYIKLGDNVAYFAGLFSGDGYQSGEHSMGVAHGPKDELDDHGNPYINWQRVIVESATRIGLDALPKERKVYLGSRATQRYFNALGLMKGNQKTLRIPAWVFKAGRIPLLNFLGGLIDTDGTVDLRSGGASITTKDPIFAGQIAIAIRTCGLRVAVEPCWNSTYERYYYRVRIPTADVFNLKSFMRHEGKISRIRDGVKPLVQQKNIIMLVEPAGMIPCFDITVGAEDHLYMTNGLITHNTGFGIIYGIGGPRLAKGLTKTSNGRVYSEAEGWKLIEKWYGVFPGVRDFIETSKNQISHLGFVQTLTGRFRRAGDVAHMKKKDASQTERTLVNAIIQGSAADVAKASMLKAEADETLRSCGARMLLQVHDELVFEVDDEPEKIKLAKKRLQEIMEDPFGRELRVPLPVEIGDGFTWASAK